MAIPRRSWTPALIVAVLIASTLASLAGAGGRAAASATARATFTDATATSGLGDVVHVHGGTGRKYYVETVPPGACWLDYDRDGWQDLYLVQSGPLPGTPRPAGSPHSRLFRNMGGTWQWRWRSADPCPRP